MANDNVQTGDALANELGRQPDETSQQHADRLLKAHRQDALSGGPIINRPALDRLEEGSCELSYIEALNAVIADTIGNIRGLVMSGAREDKNILAFAMRADTLLCLQHDRCLLAEEYVTAAVDGWPTIYGHRL